MFEKKNLCSPVVAVFHGWLGYIYIRIHHPSYAIHRTDSLPTDVADFGDLYLSL